MADHRAVDPHFTALPLIAILRGIAPDEAVAIGDTLLDACFRVIEVPMNSPEPLESIRRLSGALGRRARIGAGTVLTVQQVHDIARAADGFITAWHKGCPA